VLFISTGLILFLIEPVALHKLG